MFVRVHHPGTGDALGKVGLEREAQALLSAGWRQTSHLGKAGIKPVGHLRAAEVREAYRQLRRFVENTGWTAWIETTSAERRALGPMVLSTRSAWPMRQRPRERIATPAMPTAWPNPFEREEGNR